ncbi:jg16501 [Pararge aegeria aegeria]|uniref:Jg16501 protein n=1 Tax=Pararge aegeria aegeria TaxID=348720 RepID=A0A8S4S5L1_9NEOP|nr:jg16501 [Pararge aegeria aegeria]
MQRLVALPHFARFNYTLSTFCYSSPLYSVKTHPKNIQASLSTRSTRRHNVAMAALFMFRTELNHLKGCNSVRITDVHGENEILQGDEPQGPFKKHFVENHAGAVAVARKHLGT